MKSWPHFFFVYVFQGVAAGSLWQQQHHTCVLRWCVSVAGVLFQDGTVRVTKRRHQCPRETTGAKMTAGIFEIFKKIITF